MTSPLTRYNSDNEVQIIFEPCSTLRKKYTVNVIIFTLIPTGWSDMEFYCTQYFYKNIL